MKKQNSPVGPSAAKTVVSRLAGIVRAKPSVARASPALPVIAMAASVGGLNALSVILGGLPAGFPAALAIVMHVSPDHESILAEILNRRTHLTVKQAHTGDILCPGWVFIAPPNHHLFVAKGGHLKLSSPDAKKIHFARPSAEPLFASVAAVYRKDAIAVVLTGGDGDGSFGVQIVKDHGGKVIAQDRPTSQDFSMPNTSIETGDVDFILPLDEIAPKLIELVGAGPSSTKDQASAERAPKMVGRVILNAPLRSSSQSRRVKDNPPCLQTPFSTPAKKTTPRAVAKSATPRYAAATKAAMIKRGKTSA